MNFYIISFITGAAMLVVGIGVGYWLRRWKERNSKAALLIKGQNLLENAQRDAESLLRDARLKANEEALQLRNETEKVFLERRLRLREREGLLNRQLEALMEEEKKIQAKEADYKNQIKSLEISQSELTTLLQERRQELKIISKMSEVEAREIFLKEIERESLLDASHLASHILEESKIKAEEKARRIISLAIQRYAGEHAFEISTATITLPNDEIKGRIIGREGRNIRAFEAATGVTVLIDDTPNAVVLSGFDPVRRSVAREAMERLILDGRIHPARIEEVVAKVSQEMDETILRAGEEAVTKVGIAPPHLEIVKMLGRLHFRQSFSQNILNHSIEVAHLMGLLAGELGIEIAPAKRAGLLHDIGKAMDHEVEGPHAIIGAEFIKRYGETDAVVDGVASHHDEVAHTGLLGILVSAADAMSATRPGARSETMTTYIKRVEALEKIALSFPGVEKCFAVHAGRELRVFVQPEKITDEESFGLARTIARAVEEKLQYPGQIRVTVTRETRCVEFAK
ncbi:MAG: ribonuclease Y [Limisphaerales bacterium]